LPIKRHSGLSNLLGSLFYFYSMYYLPQTANPQFPPVEHAHESGLLAIGGKLNPRWILAAYRQGIFPWFNEGEPYCWFSPDPRLVLYPGQLRISKSMRKMLKKVDYSFSIDNHFEEVVEKCAMIKRTDQAGTWITAEMKSVYTALHRSGYAHSFEWIQNGKLAGGLYGLCIGSIFCGESMFSEVSNASKAAFILAIRWMQQDKSIHLIDCQVETPHLISLGAENISRKKYISLLQKYTVNFNAPALWQENFNSKECQQFL